MDNKFMQVQVLIMAAERIYEKADGTGEGLGEEMLKASEMWYQEASILMRELRKSHVDDPRVLALEVQLSALRYQVDTDFINEQEWS